MGPDQDFEEKERERKVRRRVFHLTFASLALIFAFDTARKHIPDDQQKLEFKVRLKYKLNEKYQQLVPKSPEGKSSMLVGLIEKELGPLLDKVNEILELDLACTRFG